MTTQQINKVQRRKYLRLKRWIIFVIGTISFTTGVLVWLLSTGRIIPYDWSYVLSALLLLCGLLLNLWALLFPLQPIEVEMRDLNRARLTHVRDLRPESLKLGDNYAAKFPYIITPIQEVYHGTIQALSNAGTESSGTKRGVLVIGESNAGKTRLAFEALRKTLYSWPVLRWRPDYNVDDDLTGVTNNNKRLVIFIDDLQDYVSSQVDNDPLAIALRTLLETLFQLIQHVVIVATCRTEDQLRVQAALNWLFIQLTEVTIPTFNTNSQDPQVAQTFAEFREKGNIHIEDWDGTIGSLILGLSTKNSQYLQLAESDPTATTILKAMKLLTKANTAEHTERRIRAVCAGVFGKEDLQKNDIWRGAVDHLTSLQFITVDTNGVEKVLVIRKDAYFTKVVTNYPQDNQPNQIEQDFKALGEVFVNIEDEAALSKLSFALMYLKIYEEAMVRCDQTLSFNPRNTYSWNIKGILLLMLNRKEEALTTFEHILTLNPKNAQTWSNKGLTLGSLGRHREALAALDQALALDPKDADAWSNKGIALNKLGRDKEVLTAYNQALALDPQNTSFWSNKGLALLQLRKYRKALASFNRALSFDSKNANAWYEKGYTLMMLWREQEALAAFDEALSLNPEDIFSWLEKGRLLVSIRQYEDGLVTLNHTLSLDPRNIDALLYKFQALVGLSRDKEAKSVLEYALSLDPKHVNTSLNQFRIMMKFFHLQSILTLMRYGTYLRFIKPLRIVASFINHYFDPTATVSRIETLVAASNLQEHSHNAQNGQADPGE
jgi:tetratricopeptide (TPR) repeat protein